ncbi:MAG: helix-turn-helix transcriptional regulator [Clostridia bacterium]|nr:helix-turn-helix transcriptional regulator [Clostridia bacterium]
MYLYSKNDLFESNESVSLKIINLPHDSCSEHIHDYLELVYTKSGTIKHKVDGHPYNATPGTLLFITPGQIHSLCADKPCEFVNILIKQDFISEYAVDNDTFYNLFRFFLSSPDDKLSLDSQMVKFKGNDAYEIKNVINFMIAASDKSRSNYSMLLNGYTRVVLTKMFEELNQKNPDRNYPKSVFFEVFDSILDYIDKNYSEPITLSTLATRCYFSPSYISREFKKFSGIGLKEYLIEKRITEAAKYLKQTDLSIETIQSKVGFSDKTRFYKEFSKFYDCTPLEYRKKDLQQHN